MLQPLRLPLALGLTLVLAACASTNPHSIGSLPDTRHTDLDKTLTIAGKKKGEEAVSLYLSAADLAWQQGDSLKARTLVDSLDLDSARPAQQIFANTLLAEMALARKQPEMALQLLQAPVFERLPELPASQQARSQEVNARALEATGQLLSAVRERIFIAGLLVDGAAHSNLESTWSLVSRLQPPVDSQAHENELNGWLALSDLVRSNSSLAQKQQGLQEWISNNPQHPAALQLPAELKQLLALQPQPLERIALLLPSHDRNQNVVNALRNGFLARYYQSKQAGQAVPELLFYDSSQLSGLGEFYQQLKQDRVDLLIGPWEKNLVHQLAEQTNLPVTTLALNYADHSTQTANNLYQFGLAAEDEARMVADRAWADGMRSVIVLVQSGDWGRRVQTAFTGHWQQLGGEVKDSVYLAQPVELAQQLGNALRLRDSEARAKQLADTLETRIHSQPARRRDVDFVFLAAPTSLARQVRPTLIFQYAGDLPVYATSAVNPGSHEPGLLHDLDGIRFTEAPWLLNTADPLKQDIVNRWPEAAGLMGRFYAMGADAYQLATQLQLLQALPNTSTNGLTGHMQLDAQNKVERRTGWAQYVNGQLEVLP